MKKGYFITFEGGEACGKSTQIAKLKDFINSLPNKSDFVFIREPGGTPLAEEIRKLLLNYEDDKPLPMTELLLFCSARSEVVNKIIKPALENGKIVIADRFYDSTIAYQGMARKIMTPKQILDLTEIIIGDLKPNLTFYFNIEPKIAFQRKAKLDENLDRIEKEGLDFHENVKKGYDFISKLEKERFVTIDATQSIDDIFNFIIKTLKEKINIIE